MKSVFKSRATNNGGGGGSRVSSVLIKNKIFASIADNYIIYNI